MRRVIPTVTSDFITSFKDTSLLSSVGVMELMMFSKNLTTVSGNITPYVAAGIFSLIVTLPLIKVVSIVENRIARSERGEGPRPKAKAQLKEAAAEESATAAHARSSVQGETPRHLRRFFSLMLTEIWIGVPSKPNSSRRERSRNRR